MIVVLASEETRLRRLATIRGMTADEARARMAAQATDEQRRAVADMVLDNDGTEAELRDQVTAAWQALYASADVRGRPRRAGEVARNRAPHSTARGARRDACASPGLLTRTPDSTGPVWWSGSGPVGRRERPTSQTVARVPAAINRNPL